MPNHCESDLTVVGDVSIINALLERYKGEGDELLDADKIMPYPQKFKDIDAAYERGESERDGFNSGGYQWCVSNWGTKWGMYEFSNLTRKPRSVSLSFQSAWSPPLPLIRKMSEDFPQLRFNLRYFEGGAGFQGIYTVKAGIVLVDETNDYRGSRGG